MIEVISTPELNRVLADGNETLIKVKSFLDNNYYFQARIYIDDLLYDTQSWSKDNSGISVKNLRKLYYHSFKIEDSINTVTGFVALSALKKKVRIEIDEIRLADNEVIESIVLPEFYIIYNVLPEYFDDTASFSLLDFNIESLKIQESDILEIPLFIPTGTTNLAVKVFAGTNLLYNISHSVSSINDVAKLIFNLSDISVPEGETELKLEITHDSLTKTIYFELVKLIHYDVSKLRVANNFGVFVPVSLFGEKRSESKYKRIYQKLIDHTEKPVEIFETEVHKINTGFLLDNQTSVLNLVTNSLNVYLKLNSEFSLVNVKTTKIKNFIDNQFVINENLVFERVSPKDANNEDRFRTPEEISNVIVDGTENVTLDISLNSFPNATHIVFDEIPSQGELSGVVNGLDSSLTINEQYTLTDITSMQFQPDQNTFNSPYSIILFRLRINGFWSAQAQLIINISEAANSAPFIDIFPTVFMIAAPNGTGSTVLNATITDPDNDSITILWTNEPGANFTITNETTATPTLTLGAGMPVGTYQVKCTATDTVNSLTSVKIVTVVVEEFELILSQTNNANNGNERIYSIKVSGGKPNSKFGLQVENRFYEDNQITVLNRGSVGDEKTISKYKAFDTFTLDLDANGEFISDISLFNTNSNQFVSEVTLIKINSDNEVSGSNNKLIFK